jgi:hypothetical protein
MPRTIVMRVPRTSSTFASDGRASRSMPSAAASAGVQPGCGRPSGWYGIGLLRIM